MASLPPDGAHIPGPDPLTVGENVLSDLVDIATSAANAQLDGLTNRLADALQRASERTTDDAVRFADAAQLLKKNRYSFQFLASERLQTVLRQEAELAARPALPPEATGSGPMTLGPDTEMDKKLCLIKAGRALDSEHAERLSALGQRLGHVLGSDALEIAHNPFRSHVFLSVIHDAWCEFHPDAAAHHLVYPLLGPNLCVNPAPILQALNTDLIKRGVLPTLAEAYRVEQVAPDVAEPDADDKSDGDPVMRQLQRLFPEAGEPPAANRDQPFDGGFPTLLAEQDVHATAARNDLFAYLGHIQRSQFDRHLAACAGNGPLGASMLAHIKRQAPAGALTAADESTIDLLAKIFDKVFSNTGIPSELKALIGSLQVPVLKAALLDKDFFFKETHPARRVIELLARLSVGWDRKKGQADPLYQVIQRNVGRIHQDPEQRAPVFAEAAWDLEAFVTREETAVTTALATPISQGLQREKALLADKAARHEVALRIGTGEVVAFVETFLEDKWVPVLTLAYIEQEERPQSVHDALQTMDDLVWSVKPKITAAERKELLAMLPRLVADLNVWLDRVDWQGGERKRFFSELAACHVSLVRAPLEVSPKRQVELALEAAKKAAERRLERQAQKLPDPEPDEFDRRVAQLQRGAWLEFAEPGGVRRLKLAWVSPVHTLFVFATRARKHALSLTDEALAAALRDGRAHILEAGGLVRRALCRTLGIPAANEKDRSAA